MKTLKAIMVEHIGDTGCWEWFIVRQITPKMTPKKAIKDYLEEMGLNTKQKIEIQMQDNAWYTAEDDVKAYEIDIY